MNRHTPSINATSWSPTQPRQRVSSFYPFTLLPFSLFTFLPFLFTSCLSDHPNDALNEQQAYSNVTSLELGTVANLYNYIGGHDDSQGLQGTCRGVYDLNTFTTDEAMLPTRGADWYDGGLWQNLYLHKWTKTDAILYDTWCYLYKVVALCNQSIEILSNHKEMLGISRCKADVAEVRALRAMFYYYIMDLWGNIPVSTSASLDANMILQMERSDAFRFIVSELEETAPLLPNSRSNQQNDYYGRMTRPVAWFLLAKLYLNTEVYCPDADKATHLDHYKRCVEMCDRLKAAGYQLEANYADCFSVHNETSVENIFTIPMDKLIYTNQFFYLFRSRHYSHGSALGLGAENGASATLTTCRANGYGTVHVDKRWAINFYADSVFTDKDDPVMLPDGDQLVYRPLEIHLDLTESKYIKTAGARMHKYGVDYTAYADGKLQSNDIVLFRYADALLMSAEAKTRLGEDGTGDFNAVRTRAGMPAINLSMMTHDQQLAAILNERLLELVWEGWRRNDLIRFGRFHFAYDERPQLKDEPTGYTTIFPIPQTVIDLNPDHIKQNEGY